MTLVMTRHVHFCVVVRVRVCAGEGTELQYTAKQRENPGLRSSTQVDVAASTRGQGCSTHDRLGGAWRRSTRALGGRPFAAQEVL